MRHTKSINSKFVLEASHVIRLQEVVGQTIGGNLDFKYTVSFKDGRVLEAMDVDEVIEQDNTVANPIVQLSVDALDIENRTFA